MRNQAQVYLGLFLIAFCLYAAQLKKKTPAPIKATSTSLLDSTPTPVPQTRMQILYEKISGKKFFSNRIGGIKLTPAKGPVKNDFTITFFGEETFTDEGFSIHPSWHTALDELAETIKTELGLHVEIAGFADQDNPKEKSPSDYGSSPYAFSFARAEWLAHYFERKHRINISKVFVLKGMGAVSEGKRIELRFYYNSPSESFKSSGDF
jgi:outer membrane protein OmpA-like peptidoglycan-associated protein